MKGGKRSIQLPSAKAKQKPKVKYMPMGVKIRMEWLSRIKAQMDLESGLSLMGRPIQTPCHDEDDDCQAAARQEVGAQIVSPEIPETQSGQTKEARRLPTERKIDKILQGLSQIEDGTASFESFIPSRKKKKKHRKGPKTSPLKTQLTNCSQELSPWASGDRQVKRRRHRSRLKSRSVSSRQAATKRPRSKRGKPTSKLKTQSVSMTRKSVNRKRSISAMINGESISKSLVARPHYSQSVSPTERRTRAKVVSELHSGPSVRSKLTPKISTCTFHEKEMKVSNVKDSGTRSKMTNQSQRTEANRKNVKRNTPDNKTRFNADKGKPASVPQTKDAKKGNSKVKQPVKTPKQQICTTNIGNSIHKTKSYMQHQMSSASKNVDKKVQVTFKDAPDVLYKSHDLTTKLEVSRIRISPLHSRKGHSTASNSSVERTISQCSDSELGSQSRYSIKASMTSTIDASDLESIEQEDLNSKGDTQKERVGILLQKVKQKLSQTRSKGHLSSGEIGFKSHLSRHVNNVFSHNQLPKTCHQLGVPFVAKNQQLKEMLLRYKAIRADEIEAKSRGKQKKRKVRKRSSWSKSRVRRTSNRKMKVQKKSAAENDDEESVTSDSCLLGGEQLGLAVTGSESNTDSVVAKRKRSRKKRKKAKKRVEVEDIAEYDLGNSPRQMEDRVTMTQRNMKTGKVS